MSAGLARVRACRRCGAVTGDIRAPHRAVHVEADPVLIYETRDGTDYGYTLDGRLVRGMIVETPGPCGAWEVYQEHRCGASEQGRAEG